MNHLKMYLLWSVTFHWGWMGRGESILMTLMGVIFCRHLWHSSAKGRIRAQHHIWWHFYYYFFKYKHAQAETIQESWLYCLMGEGKEGEGKGDPAFNVSVQGKLKAWSCINKDWDKDWKVCRCCKETLFLPIHPLRLLFFKLLVWGYILFWFPPVALFWGEKFGVVGIMFLSSQWWSSYLLLWCLAGEH